MFKNIYKYKIRYTNFLKKGGSQNKKINKIVIQNIKTH